MPAPRISRHELMPLRQSAACTDGLSKQQSRRVLDELDRVLAERDELRRIVDELRQGPWPEARRLLAELHRTLHADDTGEESSDA